MARSKSRPYLKVMVLVGIVVVFMALGWKYILEFASILNSNNNDINILISKLIEFANK